MPEFESIENFRDLASYPCRYGKMTQGVIYRSGSPFHGTEADKAGLRALGIRTIIDLRGPRIRSSMPHPFLDDPEIKVLTMDVPYGEQFPATEDDVAPLYLKFVSEPLFARPFFRAVLNAEKPLLIHCEAGKDRTGAFSLLLLLASGVSKEDCAKDYNLSYDGRLSQTKERTKVAVPSLQHFVFHMNPATIERFIDMFLKKYVDMNQYFEAMGLSEDEGNAICNLFGVQERSAGAVVFHDGRVLVEHMKMGHYSMPKGHVEDCDHSLEETAIREINEETGLDVRLIAGFETSSSYSPRPGHIKRVTWFIAIADNEDTKPQPEEVDACYFLTPGDAFRVLSHDDDRRILTEACAAYFE